MTYETMAEDNQIKEDISKIKQSLVTIEDILRGDRTSNEPSGIIYNVSKNTDFRKNMTRIIWVLFAANAGMIIHYALQLMGG